MMTPRHKRDSIRTFELSYDPESNALYLKIISKNQDRIITRSKVVHEGITLALNENDEIVGVEILL
jgi:uncharacterized protein YuzE